MPSYNFGHVYQFWNELIHAAESVESIPEHLRKIVIISPWITDLPSKNSGLNSHEWESILNGQGSRYLYLSDILLAMVDIGFHVQILTLDSEDKSLPKQDRNHLRREADFVKRLTRNNAGDGVQVLKKWSIHSKIYAFPSGIYSGSANKTNRGMLGNAENMTWTPIENPDAFNEQWININAHLNGSEDYNLGSIIRSEPIQVNIDRSGTEEQAPPIEDSVGDSNYSAPDPETDPDAYLFRPEVPVGKITTSSDSEFLTIEEKSILRTQITAFEKELRHVILKYYDQHGHEIRQWSAEGNTAKYIRKNWHRLVTVHTSEGAPSIFFDKAKAVIRRKNQEKTVKDFPSGEMPNDNDPDPFEAIEYGSTLGDLRTLLVGQLGSELYLPLTDFSGVDLSERGLIRFTSELFGRKLNRASTLAYWNSLFAKEGLFRPIYWFRNETDHTGPINRSRARSAEVALLEFEEKLFKRFYRNYGEGVIE
jgi:hypothetical protein